MNDDDDFDDEAPTNPPWHLNPDQEPPVDYGPVENQFLADIQGSPQDFPLRVVYADWLEQGGNTRKAELVRLLSVDPVEGSPEREQIRELGSQMPNDWLATISRGTIDGCEQATGRRCTQRWEMLASTDQPRVRHCAECDGEVHFCASEMAAQVHGDSSSRVTYSPILDHDEAMETYDGRLYLDAGRIYRERRGRRLPK